MVLAMAVNNYPLDVLLITPTGDELPGMVAHWELISGLVGLPLTVPDGPTLRDVIDSQSALPNFRMRFCTRMIKIVPAIAWVTRKTVEGSAVVMHVGLRADEAERKGIIDAKIETRFPLRELGMGLPEVQAFLRDRRISIPARTDCARCYHQRIGEWWDLWRNHPEIWADAESDEKRIGNTYRSPGRDTWPVPLEGLRRSFESGRVPRGARLNLELFDGADDQAICRVCSMCPRAPPTRVRRPPLEAPRSPLSRFPNPADRRGRQC